MRTYLVRFSTNGIEQTEFTLITNETMSRRDFANDPPDAEVA